MVDPGAMPPRPFALYSPEGCYYLGLHESHQDCWRVALGWPYCTEIRELQKQGWYSVEGTFNYTDKSSRWPLRPE